MGGKWYSVDIDQDDPESEWGEIENFVAEGYKVVLAQDDESLASLMGIDLDDITHIERT